jgi:NADH dehydrogenase FAD-containing subunit
MWCKERAELWAAGDCVSKPDPNGKPYPELAQHSMKANALVEDI